MLNIAIRVDASNTIGAGHFMRCLALIKSIQKAQNLDETALKVTFICANINNYCKTKVRENGFSLMNIANDFLDPFDWLICDSQKTEAALSSLGKVHLLIVDSYRIKEPWYTSKIKLLSQKIMVVDDLANRQHNCDYILDQTLDVDNQRYSHLVPSNCQIMTGKAYMLLREEFFLWRRKALNKRSKTKNISNLLISLGGSDAAKLNLTIIDAIDLINKSLEKPLNTTLVIPSTSRAISEYQSLEKKYAWLTLAIDANNMAELMFYADIAIGASGSSAWERCCLGLPTLAIEIADNQALILDKLALHGAISNLGKSTTLTPQKVKDALLKLINSNQLYLNMSKKAASCCDGKGTLRALEKLNLSTVYLRAAQQQDRDLLFNWQSQESVRKYSRTSHTITFDEHCTWFDKTLKDPNRNLFIITERWIDGSESPVGMLRLDLQGEQYEISILICPKQQGRGLAKKGIQAILPEFKLLPILATVHPENTASQILFSKAGFEKITESLFILK